MEDIKLHTNYFFSFYDVTYILYVKVLHKHYSLKETDILCNIPTVCKISAEHKNQI